MSSTSSSPSSWSSLSSSSPSLFTGDTNVTLSNTHTIQTLSYWHQTCPILSHTHTHTHTQNRTHLIAVFTFPCSLHYFLNSLKWKNRMFECLNKIFIASHMQWTESSVSFVLPATVVTENITICRKLITVIVLVCVCARVYGGVCMPVRWQLQTIPQAANEGDMVHCV